MDILQIGAAVREHRRKLGLTQTTLANESGVSRATLAALETGALAELGVCKLLRIFNRLGLALNIHTNPAYRPTLEELERMRLESHERSTRTRYRT